MRDGVPWIRLERGASARAPAQRWPLLLPVQFPYEQGLSERRQARVAVLRSRREHRQTLIRRTQTGPAPLRRLERPAPATWPPLQRAAAPLRRANSAQPCAAPHRLPSSIVSGLFRFPPPRFVAIDRPLCGPARRRLGHPP